MKVSTDKLPAWDFYDCIPGLPSMEILFMDGPSITANRFISLWAIDVISDDWKKDNIRLRGRLPASTCHIIQRLFSVEAVAARKQPLKLYIRCTTFDEVSHESFETSCEATC